MDPEELELISQMFDNDDDFSPEIYQNTEENESHQSSSNATIDEKANGNDTSMHKSNNCDMNETENISTPVNIETEHRISENKSIPARIESEHRISEKVDNNTSQEEIAPSCSTEAKSDDHSTSMNDSEQSTTLHNESPVGSPGFESDDDNVTLAEIKREKQTKRLRRTLFTLPADEEEELDDSDDDPNFKLRKTDLNSSDSEYEKNVQHFAVKKRKKKKQHTVGKKIKSGVFVAKNNKKKYSTVIKPVQRKCRDKQSKPHTDVAIERAKMESIRQHRAREILRNYHNRLLDALLMSNGYTRKEVAGDGNCFFAAVLECTTGYQNPNDLRIFACDHMKEKCEEYSQFMKRNVDDENQASHTESYLKEVEQMRENGHWSADIADALPLVIANIFGRELKIFSSNRTKPFFSIKPSLCDLQSTDIIPLAYNSVRGFEHYDACIPYNSESSVNETPTKNISEDHAKKTTEPGPSITPRKAAKYKSPPKKIRTRRRKARPELWKKNVRKSLKMAGKEYISSTGKTVPGKDVQPCNCTKCRFKCTERVDDVTRKRIFHSYWSLQSYERQRDFICSSIMETEPARKCTKARSPRGCSRSFYFDVDEKRIRVCKNFYLKTLNIGERLIETSMKGKETGVYSSSDRRGKHSPHNKTPRVMLDDVRKHINSFPVVDAHYTRKDTQRMFLCHDLNIKKMYHLYKTECIQQNKKYVSHAKYRNIFNNEYNLSFHVPKKDQCQVCTTYLASKTEGEVSESQQQSYDEHIQRKERARAEKDVDKQLSKESGSYHTATFDLEAVLQVPCSLVSQVYYNRKLCCYNLSVYSLKDGNATCYLWNETEGKRGSCEIATCILMYIKSLPAATTHVCLYSDTCTGQNRNRYMSIALMHATATIPNIQVIDQKFFESGHSQMESDSIHAAVERAKKNTSVFLPSHWDTVIRMARRKNPYTVVPLKFSDFLDFKPTTQHCLPPNLNEVTGEKVHWMKIKWLQYRKCEQDHIFFKYQFNEQEFHKLKVKSGATRRNSLSIDMEMETCYTEKLPVSEPKKRDLISLCKEGIIPSDCHGFYENLPSNKKVKDKLPVPDALEDEQDSDLED